MATTFRTVVGLEGKTATFLPVPPEAMAELGSAKRPAVTVTLAGHTYRSTVAVYGNEFFLPLNAANRAAAGVRAGDEVEVTLDVDDAPREVVVPPELAEAMTRDQAAATAFAGLSYSHRREYVEWIGGAKKPETRERRVRQALRMLAEGRTAR